MKKAKAYIKGLLELFYYPYLARRAERRLRAERDRELSRHKALEFANSFRVGVPLPGLWLGIRPLQNRNEILGLLELLEKEPPRVVCEIGTAGGGTLFLLANVASCDAFVVSIDLPGGPFGSGYQKSKERVLKAFAKSRQSVQLLREDSHQLATFESLRKMLDGKYIDFLLIDGDHRYEGVKQDFELYRPLVRKGGIIAFHDIVPGAPGYVGGVPQFWSEIKTCHRHLEFVDSWSQGGAGIGVIWSDNL